MTTYNGDKYLCLQLDSILAQTVSDFELIICDDSSKDRTWNLLEDYKSRDSRIKIFRNEHNIGFVKNFEKAISLCSGEYIALSDQDDIWKKNHLEVLLNNINGMSAAVGNSVIMDDEGNISNDLLSERDRYFVDGSNEDRLTRILFYGNPFQGTSSLYDRYIFKYALPVPQEVEYHDTWFAAVACCLCGVNYTYDVITNYRIHKSNASGTHKWNFIIQILTSFRRKKWTTDRIVLCNELKTRIPSIPEKIRLVIDDAYDFQNERIEGKKIKTIFRIIKSYKKIYATNSYKYMFARCFGILLKG